MIRPLNTLAANDLFLTLQGPAVKSPGVGRDTINSIISCPNADCLIIFFSEATKINVLNRWFKIFFHSTVVPLLARKAFVFTEEQNQYAPIQYKYSNIKVHSILTDS